MTRKASRTNAATVAAFALTTCFMALPSPCHAEGPSAGQEAQAEDLFQRAKAAMARKDYKEACPMLAESYRLAGGGGTLQNLAICYEEQGKVAFAYNRFNELRAMSQKANRPDRVKLADEHIAKLKDRISRLRIRVAPANKVTGMKISVDGDDYGEASWDLGIVVNTGTHVVVVSAPGKKNLELKKKVDDEGALETLEVPKLADAPVAAAVVPPTNGATLEELDRVASQRALRTTGFVIGGVGLATVAAGGVFGILAITTNNAAKGVCQDNTSGTLTNPGPYDSAPNRDLPIAAGGGCYGPRPGERPSAELNRANNLRDDARTFANVANVLIPVGLVTAAIGTYLIVRSADSNEPEPDGKKGNERALAPRAVPPFAVRATLVPSLGGLSLQGEFQ